MADNKLELVIQVDTDKANASIRSVNTSLSSMEQAAVKSARGASAGIDGLTVSMVRGATAGNLLADAIKSAIEFAKSWTVEAAKYAAHTAKMEAVTGALARSHGEGADAAAKAVAAIKQIGYSTQDAQGAVQKLLIADMDLGKATGLAKVAKDAAAVSTEGVGAGEAFEKIMLAIETGASRGLRTMSIFVDLQKEVQVEELKRGHTLSETEAKQVRYNAIMREAANIQGAAAGASGQAETQMAALSREVNDLREAVGSKFQDQFKSTIAMFRDLVGFLKDNADWLAKFGQAALCLAGALVTAAIAQKIWGIVASVHGLTAALAANPIGAAIAAATLGGVAIYSTFKQTQEQNDVRWQGMKDQGIRQAIGSGKSLADLRKMGYTDDQIRAAMGAKALAGEGYDVAGIKRSRDNGPDIDALKLAQDIRKKQAESNRSTFDSAIAAQLHGVEGPVKAYFDLIKDVQHNTSFVDDKGIVRTYKMTEETRENLEFVFHKKAQQWMRESGAEQMKLLREEYVQRLAWDTEVYERRIKNDADIAAKNFDHLRELKSFEQERAGYGRDSELRKAEALDAQTLQQKLYVEQRKAEIEIDYLEKVHDIKLRLFDMDTSRMVLEEESNLQRLGYRADEIKARIAELTQQREEVRQQQQESTDAAVDAARENAAIKQAQLVRDHNRQIFDSLKHQAEGVFDALLQKSQSIWSAIGNSLKTALLTAIKDVVSSRVAAMLMQLFTGTSVAMQPGTGSGGLLGRWGGILGVGAVPVFGGTTGGGWGTFGSGPMPGNSGVWSALPGMGGMAVPMSGATGSGGSVMSMAGMAGGWKGFLASGKGFLTSLGNIGAKTVSPPGMGGDFLSAGHGVGGWQGGAMLLGGGILAMDGLRRGGWLGVGETTAGGALIGAKFGGPIGAVIGGAVGFGAGMLRMLFGGKSPEDRVREKVKSTYGIDIAEKPILTQIANIARQSFGGDYDLAIQTQQVRELIELYAMHTGQTWRGRNTATMNTSILQTGGGLQFGGYPNAGGLLESAPWTSAMGISAARGSSVPGSAQPVQVTLSLDPEATKDVLEGRAVQAMSQNPRAVASAVENAYQGNFARREMYGQQAEPGLLVG
jgi:hypothetical protein